MLRRIADARRHRRVGDALADDGKAPTGRTHRPTADVLAPLQMLDGFGTAASSPPPTTQAIAAAKIADARPSAEHPPGYYGPPAARAPLNVIDAQEPAEAAARAAGRQPSGASTRATAAQAAEAAAARRSRWRCCSPTSSPCCCCRPAASLMWRPAAPAAARRVARPALALPRRGAGAPSCRPPMRPPTPQPQPRRRPDGSGRRAAPATAARHRRRPARSRFGYVLTGDAATDEASRQGLDRPRPRCSSRAPRSSPASRSPSTSSPTRSPSSRCSTGRCCRTREPLPEATLAKIDAYMKQGGMIIFDTQGLRPGHAAAASPRAATAARALQRLLGKLDMPAPRAGARRTTC